MNADLEEMLGELGPDYRDMVRRMKAPFEERRRLRLGWMVGGLAAASLLAFLGLSVFFRGSTSSAPERVYTVRAASAANSFMLAHADGDEVVRELVRTQRADGGWDNDFLTRQNAARLASATSADARLAYRRALRNLRLRGLRL